MNNNAWRLTLNPGIELSINVRQFLSLLEKAENARVASQIETLAYMNPIYKRCQVKPFTKDIRKSGGCTYDTLGPRMTVSPMFGGTIPSISSKQSLKLKFQALLCSIGNTPGRTVFPA